MKIYFIKHNIEDKLLDISVRQFKGYKSKKVAESYLKLKSKEKRNPNLLSEYHIVEIEVL